MKKQYNKTELLQLVQQERDKLEKTLAPLSVDEYSRPGVTDAGWAVKDVLAHLFTWEGMVRSWYAAGLRGEKPELPAPGFKWNQTPALNQKIFEQHRSRPLQDIQAEFQASYQEMLKLIQEMPEEDLLTPAKYKWEGKWSMGNYIESSTSSHYRWARDLIRKWLKGQG